ncbi:tetratricopeptide repeat protein [Seongchinamella unica]|uniref:Tetratricopeptide repeat protein n=1 Tax=Seongchinamella unica TaxID=2547392 RepID=A0A4R5LQV6_9GAMM|nr:tetratricopeptide repeat protein [Seongchinamella unica]TDG12931.1 tetratricopeptide repeat protein [Seongchinamella unica]
MAQQPAGWFTHGVAPFPGGWRALCLLVSLLCSACASHGPASMAVANIAPLSLHGQTLSIADVSQRVQTPDLLALDEEMRHFVDTYTAGIGSRRQRLRMLHRAVSGPATLGVDYDPFAEGTAREAFHRRSANCLSYANLFVALAREAGLDARYQWLDVRPSWTRMGERVAVRLHVNAVVHLSSTEQFMVDLDPLPARDIAGSREIADRDAQALYHNNIAMNALARDQLGEAWLHEVRALQLSPRMAHLWVNLGVVYRRTEQHEAAEMAYLQALEIDPWERSAMNNLMVLYELLGREEEHAYWLARVDSYRDTNPFYHAWLGDQAAEEGDWRGARVHYSDALDLEPNDARLLYSMGLIYRELGQPRAALRYIDKAINQANLYNEQETYRAQYEAISRAMASAP